MKPVVLETARLRLDSPVDADEERVLEYCQDPLFERYLTTPWPYRPAHAEFFVQKFVPGGWAADREYTWAIRLRAENDRAPGGAPVLRGGGDGGATGRDGDGPAGDGGHLLPGDRGDLLPGHGGDGLPGHGGDLLGVVGFDREHTAIGFWLGAPHRGHRYMPEAVTAVAQWVFSLDALAVEAIRWECVVGNLASASVARQLGFRFTGERDSAAPHRDGSPITSWHAELTPENLGVPQPGWAAATSPL